MPYRTSLIAVLLFAVFLAGWPAGEVKAQSLCIPADNFKVSAGKNLEQKLNESDFAASELRKKLVEKIEDYFIENRVTLKSCNENYDFELTGTVEVRDMLEGTRGFLLVFSTDSLRIVPAKKKKFLPTLTFKDISGDQYPGWQSTHSTDPWTAVRNGLDCFLQQMKEKSVFDFLKHPLIREAITLNREKLEQMEKEAEMGSALAEMIKAAKDDMQKTFKTEIPAAISGLAGQIKEEFRKNLAVLLGKIEQLENRVKNQKTIDRQDIEKFRALIDEFNAGLDAFKENQKLVNYIIVYVTVPADLPAIFKQTYIKPKTCNNCSAVEIKADNIKKMTRPQDIDLLDQNAGYGYPLKLDGEISHNNGIVTITLPEESYNKIFKLDSDSDFKILASIKDVRIDYPRLFVMEEKYREK